MPLNLHLPPGHLVHFSRFPFYFFGHKQRSQKRNKKRENLNAVWVLPPKSPKGYQKNSVLCFGHCLKDRSKNNMHPHHTSWLGLTKELKTRITTISRVYGNWVGVNHDTYLQHHRALIIARTDGHQTLVTLNPIRLFLVSKSRYESHFQSHYFPRRELCQAFTVLRLHA